MSLLTELAEYLETAYQIPEDESDALAERIISYIYEITIPTFIDDYHREG